MKDKIRNAARNTVEHVSANRAKYSAAATASAFVVLMYKRAEQWNTFLDEHGLREEFYEITEG